MDDAPRSEPLHDCMRHPCQKAKKGGDASCSMPAAGPQAARTASACSCGGGAPLYFLFTAVVVLSERVETTVQKAFFRALGTVIGGAASPSSPETAGRGLQLGRSGA